MIIIPFLNWFYPNALIGGDWRFFWPENLKEILSYSYAWDSSLNTGLGQSNIFVLWLNSYLAYGANLLVNILHIPWVYSEKILFFWPMLLVALFSSFVLSRYFIKNFYLNGISSIIYITNTYALMLFSGGQVGIGLAYAISPLLCFSFIKLIDNPSLMNIHIVLSGAILGISLIFDPRITFISMMMIGFYALFEVIYNNRKEFFTENPKRLLKLVKYGIVSIGIAFSINAFWILPQILIHNNPVAALGSAYNTVTAFRFFSFTDFSHALSLLHPNWPENIFGKTYFLRPEFLLLPLLAFSSLFFHRKYVDDKKILFFVFIALFSTFLIKGANEPFGQINEWFFLHIPGFILFRDTTKFFLLLAICYAILIPFSISKIFIYFNKKEKNILLVTFIVFLFFWLLLIHDVFQGRVGGTFKKHNIPQEYAKLRNFIAKDTTFSRTLWVPSAQRFGYFSNIHPALSASGYFNTTSPSALLKILDDRKTLKTLQGLSVKYIIVPYDSESEIFLNDRKYDDKLYQQVVKSLDANKNYIRKAKFGKISIYEVSNTMSHFRLITNQNISVKTVSPVEYRVIFNKPVKDDTLIFSEGFDPQWSMVSGNQTVMSKKFDTNLNSFKVTEQKEATIYFETQRFVGIGKTISEITFLIVLVWIIYLMRYNKRQNRVVLKKIEASK